MTDGMTLPQHIIDLVGDLYDKGLDDESICLAVIFKQLQALQVFVEGRTMQ